MPQLVRHADVTAFVAHASPLLLAREADNNLILGLCVDLAVNPLTYGDEPPLLRTVDEGGTVLLAAFQTPPHRLVLSHAEQLDAAELLAGELAREGRSLPGVAGPVEVAERFAHHWSALTGIHVEQGIAQRIYELTAVVPPAPVHGRMRHATEADRPVLIAWFEAFFREAMGEPNPDAAMVESTVSRWLGSPIRQLGLWEHGGPVAMAGATGPTPSGIRIGAVYTPPEQRQRGYASALVATLSQAQLDAGKTRCFLYTDLSNPTSNHIYQAIGYRPVVDIGELNFRA